MNIIFTAIFDSYDKLNEVTLPSGWRAICFTNTPIESNTWEIVQVEKYDKVYRDIKIRPHVWLPDHTKSVWIDGNLEIMIPLDKFIKDKGFYHLMEHPDRNCVYEEAKRCIELGKDSEGVISAQVERYRQCGLKEKSGLWATGCIVRYNCWPQKCINDAWWREVQAGSVRDQIAFAFVANKMDDLLIRKFPFLENIKYHYHVEKQRQIDERERIRATRKRKRGRITEAYRKMYGKR